MTHKPTITTGGIGCSICGAIIPWGAAHYCAGSDPSRNLPAPNYFEAWQKAEAEIKELESIVSSYGILQSAVEQSLQSCIVEDDVAEEAIYADAIETAGVAISEADDIFHSIRVACARDLARKHNSTLQTIIVLIDGEWEASVPFGRLHEARRSSPVATEPETVTDD